MLDKYHWILFDADDTLFTFDAFQGLRRMFAQFKIEFTEDHFKEYQTLNKSLWVQYQNNEITAEQLKYTRFTLWGEKLNKSPNDLNSAFLQSMAEICSPMEGAVSLLNALKGKVNLGIITNGFVEVQEARIKSTGFGDLFSFVVISEKVGVAKPNKAIFEHAYQLMGNPERSQVLMVGDTPESDILGGINAGFDTCWVNHHAKIAPENIVPRYEVANLNELLSLLSTKKTMMTS